MIERRLVDVLIIGGGPAGLSAARRLKNLGVESVLVCERKSVLGGTPLYSNHFGFGPTLTTGPFYAVKLIRDALKTEC